MALFLRTFLLVLLVSSLTNSAVKKVTISKCCGKNEYLTRSKECIKTDQNQWKLRVYLPAKKNFVLNKLLPHWMLKENVKPNCTNPFYITGSTNYLPLPNGSALFVEFNKLVGPDDYCLDYDSSLVCLNEPNVVVKKCCLDKAILSETNQTCIHMKDSSYQIDIGSDKHLGAGFPSCNDNSMIVAGKLHENQLLTNGSLWLSQSKVLLPAGDFCLEHTLEHTGRSPSILTCQDYLPSSQVIVTPAQTSDLRFTIYPIGLGLSAIFLAATLVAGSLLPASHHVLHWRCQTNHVICLLFGDILLCITHLSGRMDSALCIIIAVSMHFLFLAAFFWLNTMCFNIWWTFRDLRPQSTEKRQERIRLRLYEAYAWGVPLLIASIAAILDILPQNPDYDFLRPKFGERMCWFYGDMEILTFFFGPVGTLLFVNFALFVLTARELTCGLWKRELVKSTTERAALGRVCMKLVIVMGVTWIADVVSWAVGGPQELWYVTDIINCLQGVFIFIVVGCQPQVLSAIKRVWCLRKHRQNGIAGTTNQHSSSSQGPPSMGDTLTNTNSVTTQNTTKSVPLETSC